MPLFSSSKSPRPAPRSRGSRWLFHGMLFLALSATGGGLIVLPQWIALDGARSSLAVQQERDRVLTERLEALQAMQGRLRSWQQDERKVFLSSEVARYPILVGAAARKSGAHLKALNISASESRRWAALRNLTMRTS